MCERGGNRDQWGWGTIGDTRALHGRAKHPFPHPVFAVVVVVEGSGNAIYAPRATGEGVGASGAC